MNKKDSIKNLENYVDKVFFYCIKRCNNRMDAEDLSQTILLECINQINKGTVIENMDYYIWGICKNMYNQYLRKTIKNRERIEYMEDINCPSIELTPLETEVENEKIKVMNAAIKLLSKDYAEILYAYYVEDKTLKFISLELKLPLGTVKWKLSEIRKKLKEYVKMERLNGKKAYVPKSFQVVQSNDGELSFNPGDVVKPLLIKNLLYHSYGNECSVEDYSIEMGISKPYVEDYLQELVRNDFLLKLENGKYLSNIAFIDKKERREILNYGRNNINNFYNAVVKYAKDNLEYYKSLLDETDALDEHLMWSLIGLIVVFIEGHFDSERTKRKDGSSWDMLLCETVDKLYPDEFFVSFNGTFNKVEGHHMGINAFPSMHWKEDGKASDIISYDRALTGKMNLNVLHNILIKKLRFSEMNEETKEIVKEYEKMGIFDVKENKVKINIPVISIENNNILKKKIVEDKQLIDTYKELYNGVYMKVRSLVPSYLEKQTPFIIQATFNTVRSLVFSRAFDEELIKDDNTKEVFVYNGLIFK